jgi:hypothetical protein
MKRPTIFSLKFRGDDNFPAGAFFDAFGRGRDLWNCISVDAFDSPNLAGISLEQLLEMDPSKGGPLDQKPVSYLVPKRWVYDQHKVMVARRRT